MTDERSAGCVLPDADARVGVCARRARSCSLHRSIARWPTFVRALLFVSRHRADWCCDRDARQQLSRIQERPCCGRRSEPSRSSLRAAGRASLPCKAGCRRAAWWRSGSSHTPGICGTGRCSRSRAPTISASAYLARDGTIALISLGLAWLTYHFVEHPIRTRQYRGLSRNAHDFAQRRWRCPRSSCVARSTLGFVAQYSHAHPTDRQLKLTAEAVARPTAGHCRVPGEATFQVRHARA